MINTKPLILASQSKRRKSLLKQLDIKIKTYNSDIDEDKVKLKKPKAYVKKLSFLKAKKASAKYPNSWILAADTIVVLDNVFLGKPKSKKNAVKMLNMLNNSKHYVYTGFCIFNKKEKTKVLKAVKTIVYFHKVTKEQINWYVDTGEPFGKAGACSIQSIGAFFIKKISGSYSNVIGLPIGKVVKELLKLNIIKF